VSQGNPRDQDRGGIRQTKLYVLYGSPVGWCIPVPMVIRQHDHPQCILPRGCSQHRPSTIAVSRVEVEIAVVLRE
jgi:hypothetical protein